MIDNNHITKNIIGCIAKSKSLSYKQLSKNFINEARPVFYIPEKNQFKALSPGEAWIVKNLHRKSLPPRGCIVPIARARFKNRTWQKDSNGLRHFLPIIDPEK